MDTTQPASALARFFLQEDINFLVTNRLPRRLATKLVGRYSQIRSPALTRATLAMWSLFADDLCLEESAQQDFESLHECFIRKLKPGARPIDPAPDTVVSPCDAIVGARGRVWDATALQAKGFRYRLRDLLCDDELVERYRRGSYVTLRLKSNMYHRFHAPFDCRVRRVDYISGDTWNVNPIALKRVESLFCRNERAVVDLEMPGLGHGVTLVMVAAILVASIRLHCLGETFRLDYRGANRFECDTRYAKGEELGYFHAGSTILVFADERFRLSPLLAEGAPIRMGSGLLHVNEGGRT